MLHQNFHATLGMPIQSGLKAGCREPIAQFSIVKQLGDAVCKSANVGSRIKQAIYTRFDPVDRRAGQSTRLLPLRAIPRVVPP